MDGAVEHEICANCKKEIPHYNYVMHTAHCSRNITLCPVCKEPIPKNQFEAHKKLHKPDVRKIDETLDFPKQVVKPKQLETKSQQRKDVHSSKSNVNSRNGTSKDESYRRDGASGLRHSSSGLADDSYSRKHSTNSYSVKQSNHVVKTENEKKQKSVVQSNVGGYAPPKSQSSLLACKFCDLELPKLELESHENYCGARTDKCNECGELVMFKYKKLHEETNHGFLKLNDEPGPRPTWDSDTQRPSEPSYMRRQRPAPIYTVNSFDFSPVYTYGTIGAESLDADNNNGEKRETYKDISRRLDCKTEYIRNLLHDSASITVPLRRSGTVPRNHFYHDKGPAPQPPSRRKNPPTEIVIPCEFCHTPIPHEELIQHETGCRPDLARFNPRRRSPSPDDYFVAPEPSSPDVDLPCEFCADMFPASELLRHQSTCN